MWPAQPQKAWGSVRARSGTRSAWPRMSSWAKGQVGLAEVEARCGAGGLVESLDGYLGLAERVILATRLEASSAWACCSSGLRARHAGKVGYVLEADRSSCGREVSRQPARAREQVGLAELFA